MTRNIETREGYEFWDRLNRIPKYGFLLAPNGDGVHLAEGIGNWIDRHEAQVVMDDAQAEVNELREQNAKLEAKAQALREEVAAANDRADTLEHRMMGMMTRHFAEAWRTRDTEKALDGYLSAGIAELERERDAALAEVAALRARVVVAWPEEVQMVLALADRIDEANEKPIAIALDGARILRDLTRLNGKSISAETLHRIDLVLAAIRSHDFHGIINSAIGGNWREEVDAMRCELRDVIGEGKEDADERPRS